MGTELTYAESWKYSQPMPDTAQIEKSLVSLKKRWKGMANPWKLPEKELVGIEVEVERSSATAIMEFWINKEDNSLRNNGREFVTEIVPAIWVPYLMENLIKGLGVSAEFTDRCSTHVHVNVRDMTDSQLLSFLTVYYVFERLLFGFVGGGRWHSVFCVPLQQTDNYSRTLHYLLLSKKPLNEKRFVHVPTEKYAALNTLPLSAFGSWEFRHMVGTKDWEKVVVWVGLLLRMKSYAKSVTWPNLVKTVAALNTTSQYGGFLYEVFDTLSSHLMVPNLQKEMEQNIADVKLSSVKSPMVGNFNTVNCVFYQKRHILLEKEQTASRKKLALDSYPWMAALHLHATDNMTGFKVPMHDFEEDDDGSDNDNQEDGEEF